jgi:hypothetical protein
MQVIWVKSEPEYFCAGDWTGKALICPSGIGNARLPAGPPRRRKPQNLIAVDGLGTFGFSGTPPADPSVLVICHVICRWRLRFEHLYSQGNDINSQDAP